jgi:RNA polymerase sporulation-specific sigma factor
MNSRLTEMNLPRFPLLPEAQMVDLLKKAKAGDQIARDTLVNCNLKLIFNLVQRFAHRGYELEDLFQIGTIGLIKAIDKFDFTYNVKFSTYAVPMIVGEIRRFLRDDSPVKVSRSYKELVYKINRAKEALTRELGREPTLNEVAANLAVPREDLITALEAVQSPTSIHETLYQDDSDPIYVLDQLSGQKQDDWFDHLTLKEVIAKLPDREKEVILLRFFQDKTQNEVAALIGLSQVQISRIERSALKHIRELLQPNDIS